MSSTNLYERLGLDDKNASAELIAKKYRQLALQFHPDRNLHGAEQFKAICEAYEILSDTEKRAMYDLTGVIGGENATAGTRTAEEEQAVYEEISKMVSDFARAFRGSEEEKEQCAAMYRQFKGNMASIIEGCLFMNDEGEPERIHSIITELINKKNIECMPAWEQDVKSNTLRKIVRQLNKERKEAAEDAKRIEEEHAEKRTKRSRDENEEGAEKGALTLMQLRATMKERAMKESASMIAHIEDKYCATKRVKKGKKNTDR